MNKLLFNLTVATILFQSCGSEEQKESKKYTSEKKDSVAIEDTNTTVTDEVELEPRERLPKHMGSWIDRNLDNPVFFSTKVDDIVHKSKAKFVAPDEAMDVDFDYMNAKEIKKLTTKELLYYAMAYPATFSQVCAEGLYDTTANVPKISGYIPFSYESEEMSDLQWNEINRRRDSVIILLCNFMDEHPDRIDTDYLRLLKRLDAIEAFPTVMKTASDKNGNYSYLLEFMYDNEYAPLRETEFYEKMYGEDAYYNGNRVPSTPALKKQIMKLAKDFYKMMDAD